MEYNTTFFFFANWPISGPTLPISQRACVQLTTSGVFEDADCSQQTGYIVEIPGTNFVCNNKTYRYVQSSVDWQTARRSALAEG